MKKKQNTPSLAKKKKNLRILCESSFPFIVAESIIHFKADPILFAVSLVNSEYINKSLRVSP